MINGNIRFTFKENYFYFGIPMIAFCFFWVNKDVLNYLELFEYEGLLILSYIASVVDLRSKRVPNVLILMMVGYWSLFCILRIFFFPELSITILKGSLAGFLLGGGLFLLVYIVSRKGLGGGDVKFMAVTGLYLGFERVLSMMLIGTVLASVVGLVLILSKKMGRKETIPMIPFLYVGMLLSVF